jgi:Tfp pilus assembly protein PilX
MTALAANFPDNSGYVIAAYLVFFALLVIYLAITAFRLVNLERRLTDLTEHLDATESAAAAETAAGEDGAGDDGAGPDRQRVQT